MILAKVCILGEISVGKTSLIRRFVDRTFSETYLSTVGVTISRKLVHTAERPGASADDVQMILWDIQGGHDFDAIAPSYLRGAYAAVIVADRTRNITVEALGAHIDRFRSVNPSGIVLVALNKADLQSDPGPKPPIDPASLQGVLQTCNTSAKTGEGVDELFTVLATHLQQRVQDGPSH